MRERCKIEDYYETTKILQEKSKIHTTQASTSPLNYNPFLGCPYELLHFSYSDSYVTVQGNKEKQFKSLV